MLSERLRIAGEHATYKVWVSESYVFGIMKSFVNLMLFLK